MSHQLRDSQLVARSQSGDPRATDQLIHRHRSMCERIANGFFIPGSDQDDVVQEALIGLTKAIRDYRETPGSDFEAFAGMCIRRNVITAVKNARRLKHAMLNEAGRRTDDDGGRHGVFDLVDLAEARDADPHASLEFRDDLAGASAALRRSLSPLQAAALIGTANGMPYGEIADLIGANGAKSVDNACQHAVRKLHDWPADATVARGVEFVCTDCGHRAVGFGELCNVCLTRGQLEVAA